MVWIGAASAKLLGLPHVWHVHEYGWDTFDFTWDLGKRLSLWWIRSSSRVILFNSGTTAAKYREYGAQWPERILYQGFEPIAPAGERMALDVHELRLGVVGFVNEQKRQADAIRALAILAERGVRATLAIIGHCEDAYASDSPQTRGRLRCAVLSLSDSRRFETFVSLAQELPLSGGEEIFASSKQNLQDERGWRFLGQRFGLDALILNNLVFDKVGSREHPRHLPSGLDVMAAFDSRPAFGELDLQGITSFPNYNEQMDKMQQAVESRTEAQWLERFYDGWLYAFLPTVQSKDARFPAYMQTLGWSYKDLNAALGSWAELKHDKHVFRLCDYRLWRYQAVPINTQNTGLPFLFIFGKNNALKKVPMGHRA